ncbi:MAG: hypothetical protein K4304_10790 [Propionicimonas sp.]
MTVAVDALRKAWVERVISTPCFGGELLLTPWDLFGGRSLDLLVREVDRDWFLVSDRGLIADRLADASVDVTRGAAARSWQMLRRGLVTTFVAASEFEIATTATRADLGRAINDVAARALQGDSLRVLSRSHRPQGLAERAMERAAAHNLGVLPETILRNRFGGSRKVSFLVEGNASRRYVMALGRSASFVEDHDRAKLAFDGAQASSTELVSLIGSAARPLEWHLNSLRSVSQVVEEDDQDTLWAKVA